MVFETKYQRSRLGKQIEQIYKFLGIYTFTASFVPHIKFLGILKIGFVQQKCLIILIVSTLLLLVHDSKFLVTDPLRSTC